MTESSRKPKLPPDQNLLKAAGLALGIGSELAVFLILGYWLGSWYDHRAGTSYGQLVGMLIGFIVGLVSVISLIQKLTGVGKHNG